MKINMRFKLLIFSLVMVAAMATPISKQILPRAIESDRPEFRLPGTITPYTYNINLHLLEDIFNGNNLTFFGNTNILFSVNQTLNSIQIHANLRIINIFLGANRNNITTATFNETTSILTIPTTNLAINTNYTLSIEYHGQIDPLYMRGFYRSSYINGDGLRRYLVSTQFQPDYARNAFPCFDEPQYKAVFTMSIVHPTAYSALCNSNIRQTTAENTTFTRTDFVESPRMSSYLVAFAVSDFTCSGLDPIAPNVLHRICSKTNAVNDRGLANQYSPRIMQALENVTGINYNISHHKMDQIAIPDFSAGAMENWGLVTYREIYLLYNETESSNVDKQNVISIIAHEFAHMWFGNLITTRWWNNLFLNEGFASFYEYFAPAMLDDLETAENFQFANQFVVDQVQNALRADGLNSSRALSAQASSSAEIWAKFDTISYHKGASILRMVEHFMGSENFKAGIQDYIITYSNSSTVPWNLWSSLQKFIQPGIIPQPTTLEVVMNNWINQSGYPVVNVTSSGNDVFISQKRFLYNGSDSTQWYVPISYTTAANASEFLNSSAKEWLIPGNYVVRLAGVLANNSWIILNNRQSSFYRVNYDANLWSRIRQVLLTNHTIIDVLTRAQIVDDVLNLARAGELRYADAMGILAYLTNETDYYPLYSAATNIDILQRLVGESSTVGRELNELQLRFLNTVRGNISFTNLNSSDQINTLRHRLILGRLCRLGDAASVSTALSLYQNVLNGTGIDRNLKSVVYCNGLRYSTNTTRDWFELWYKFGNTSLSTEKVTILTALGCIRNTTLLYHYLNESISNVSGIRPQDLTRVWSSVINSNPEGLDVAFNFYANNTQRIIDYFSSGVSLISTIASRFNTQEQIARLETLVNNSTLPQVVRDASTAAVSVARSNYNWREVMHPQLEEHFRRPVVDGAVRTMSVSLIVLICSSIMFFV